MATNTINMSSSERITPGRPNTVEHKEGLVYILKYKDRSHIDEKYFLHDGDLSSAIGRSQIYCEKMRFRFIHCSPFLTNFEEDEKRISVL